MSQSWKLCRPPFPAELRARGGTCQAQHRTGGNTGDPRQQFAVQRSRAKCADRFCAPRDSSTLSRESDYEPWIDVRLDRRGHRRVPNRQCAPEADYSLDRIGTDLGGVDESPLTKALPKGHCRICEQRKRLFKFAFCETVNFLWSLSERNTREFDRK